MDRQEFYEILDICSGSDFRYFENMAELFESSEHIGSDLIYQLLKKVNLQVFSDLIKSYFAEMENSVPDSETDLFTLIDTAGRSLSGMARVASDETDDHEHDDMILRLADEIDRFREWYSISSSVICVMEDEDVENTFPVRDALAFAREEKLGLGRYRFDFSAALDYSIEEFIMTFGDLEEIQEGSEL